MSPIKPPAAYFYALADARSLFRARQIVSDAMFSAVMDGLRAYVLFLPFYFDILTIARR